MNYVEHAVVFPCAGESLLGILAKPESSKPVGVLVAVGGPQYRVGSHRQFVLLARALAEAGYPVFRFDYRGMGDSTGAMRSFESVNADFAAAIDAFRQSCPGIEKIILWGLCDAASASLLYWDATHDQCVGGMVLLNPWARSEATLAKTRIKHYYGQRLVQVEFWRKLLSGKLGITRALRGFADSLIRAGQTTSNNDDDSVLPFQQRMMRALDLFPGPSLLILSADDYTAKEFLESCQGDVLAQRALAGPMLTRLDLVAADHTFSSRELRQRVEAETLAWLHKSVVPGKREF